MISCGRTLVFAFGLAVAAAGAEVPVEFSGVLITDGVPKVAIRDKQTGTTRWLEPGGRFNGYALASYSAKDDVVVLRKDGREYRLTLVASSPTSPTVAATAPAPVRIVTTPSPPPPAREPVRPIDAPAPAPLPVTPRSPPAPTNTPSVPTVVEAPHEALAGQTGAATSAPSTIPAESSAAAAAAPDITAAPAAGNMTGPSATVITRTAQPGDSAASIARAAGLTLEQLRALNPAINPDSIQPGQPIRIR